MQFDPLPRPFQEPFADGDADPQETREWLDALEVREGGHGRGHFLLKRLEEQAQQLGIVERISP